MGGRAILDLAQEKGDELPIIQYWHSREIPSEVADLVGTFPELNPDMRHLLFCEAEAEEFIERHFTARELAAFRSCAVPAMQADYFRYCAIHALGGVYCDADFGCRRPLRPLVEKVDGGLLFTGLKHGYLMNGFFVFPSPGHPLLRLAINLATANIEQRAGRSVHAVTGPLVFSGLRTLVRLGSFEAVRRKAAGAGLEWFMASLSQAVDDHARVVEAFEGVRTAPFETAMEWVGPPTEPLRYKRGETHWTRWRRRGVPIFK